jgi:hypothetical protein
MSDERAPLRRILWLEVFPWLMLLRAPRLALDARRLFLATVALALTALGWWSLAWLFSGRENDPQLLRGATIYRLWPWEGRAGEGDWDFNIAEADRPSEAWRVANPLLAPWRRLADPLLRAFDADLTWVGLAFYLLCALWALAVWACFGAGIARLTAVEMTRDERLSLRAALRHAVGKWREYFTAPLLPLVGVLLAVVPLALIGLLLRADVSTPVAGLLWPLALLLGLLAAIFLVGLWFGWPLMWGALATEEMDSWDAISRSYAYVYQRPWHYLFYALVASGLGVVAWLFVSGFATAVLYLTAWGASWGAGNVALERVEGAVPSGVEAFDWPAPPAAELAAAQGGEPGALRLTGAALIGVCSAAVRLVALGFVYSYFWTAATTIYLLLRKDTDDTPLDEIHFDEPADALGLPPMEPDAAGVPTIKDRAEPAERTPPDSDAPAAPEVP